VGDMQAILHHGEVGSARGGRGSSAPVGLWAHLPAAATRGVVGRVRSLWTGVGAAPFSYVVVASKYYTVE